ncbi:hypothetical protein B296_00031876 [Ensete ventricosum]|uniref:Uncharacterized protein n=1 Tax=Ensete ventricosum TaxID=4639 RepID=A0A427A4W9_ENSVE|nr:hypothetical protein B296_00031876 [Ensete ventricosum]
MTQLKVVKDEDPIMPRWSAIAGSNQFWIEDLLSGEYLCGALHPTLANLDGARDDRAWLEGDVLSLIEATMLLEAELKDEGAKAVVSYKASRGFEYGLEKMGRSATSSVTRWHSSGYGASIRKYRSSKTHLLSAPRMDLRQPFNDSSPSEK